MPVPTPNNSHVATALSRLTSMFQKPVIQGIVKTLANENQTLENAIQDFIFKIQLANHPLGGGPWDILDKLGKIVGEPRMGRSDADYVPAIKIRIRVNRSQGLAEDIIQITSLLFAGAVYREFWPAAFDVSVAGAQAYGAGFPVVAVLARFLSKARSAGTYGTVRSQVTSSQQWILGDTHGASVGATGLADFVGGNPNTALCTLAAV